MKYGVKYIKPKNEEVQDYLNKISPGPKNISELAMDDYMNIISEAIPKKVKKPEFQVINHTKKEDKSGNVRANYPQERSTIASSDVNSEFLYSSIRNEPSESLQSNSISKIEEPKQVAGIISSIKKENKSETRKELSVALNNITNPNCLTRFLQLNGTTHLGYWIDDYREEIESKDKVDQRVFEILSNILNFCDKLPISVHDLKISKIGKKINKLGKCIEDEKIIKLKCEELVIRWKKMIESIKEKKKTSEYVKIEKESKYSIESSDEKTTPDVILSPNKQISNYQSNFSENFSMLRKTQRSEYESGSDKNYKKIRVEDNEKVENNLISNYKNNSGNGCMNHNLNLNFYGKSFNINQNSNLQNFNNTNNNFRKNVSFTNMNVTNLSNDQNKIQVQNQNISLSSTQKSLTAKGILKKANKPINKEKKIKVRWEMEERLERVKIFKLTDEVEAPAVSEEEYQKIQIEILKNPNYKFLNDMRSKEINMEKENLSKAREKNKITKDILYKMIPSMPWMRPCGKNKIVYKLELFIPSNSHNDSYDQDDENNNGPHNNRGSESEEKNIINLLCQKILSVTYFRESEIPDCPQMGLSELFSFTDENIPKIENFKAVYNSDKPNQNAEIFEYIDNLSETKLTPEIISTISQKIQNNQFSQEEKTKILDYLKQHLNKDSIQPSTSSQQFNSQASYFKNFIPQINQSSSHNQLNMNMNNAYNYNNGVNMTPVINPLNNKINNQGGTIPIMNYQDKKIIGKTNDTRDTKMNFNMNLNKIFTRPCRNYHGPNGCNRGDHCHFIHDQTFQGREIPNFNLNNYRNYGQSGNDKRYLITNVNIVNNYGNISEENEKGEICARKDASSENRVKDGNNTTPIASNQISNIVNTPNKDSNNFVNTNMGMNANSNYMHHKQYQNNNYNQGGNKMLMHGYHMNPQIRPPFLNNLTMNMKNSIPPNSMNMNQMNKVNMSMNMGMNMNMNNTPNIPNMTNIPNMSNMSNPANNPANIINTNNPNNPPYMSMQPNPYMFMNNYGRMPFNMMTQHSNTKSQTGFPINPDTAQNK